MSMNDAQYLSELEATNESQKQEIESLRAQIKRMQGYKQRDQTEADDKLKHELEHAQDEITNQVEHIGLLTHYCKALNGEIETPEHLKGFYDVVQIKLAVKHLLKETR